MTHHNENNSHIRCPWPGDDANYIAYHDTVWGVPVYDDITLFKFLILESAQAGLSWITILRRQNGYKTAFDNFNIKKVASYSSKKIDSLMQNNNIIRNRKKIVAAVTNAQRVLKIQSEFDTFSNYFWHFSSHLAIQNSFTTMTQVPSHTPLSKQISDDMRKRGFQFIGPTVMYAYMQAVGMVNDHLVTCYRHQEISNLMPKKALQRIRL